MTPERRTLAHACQGDEHDCVAMVRAFNDELDRRVDCAAVALATAHMAYQLIDDIRQKRARASGVDALMQQFSLSSEEGTAFLSLAEALLRIPDPDTASRFIADKLGAPLWHRHLGKSPALLVNAATWGLVISSKLVTLPEQSGVPVGLGRLLARFSQPLVRNALVFAMQVLGQQFVCGQTITQALRNSVKRVVGGYQYSYDMLGEAALTAADATRYLAGYEAALHAIGTHANGRGIRHGPGISVKLSALHPRYCSAQRRRVLGELLPTLKRLVLLAKSYAIGITIDAEESERLDLSLDILDALAGDPDLAGFDGLGFVVQAYQKRAPCVIDYLAGLCRRSGCKLMVRLVKGAYWDSEIKRAQIAGLRHYPVFTRKVHTDMCYLVCAKKLLLHTGIIYPQFATHNAQTLAAIHAWAGAIPTGDYEFQCLYGMGETLYDAFSRMTHNQVPCRIYAPVGAHRTLLAYLVRRLLENGANSSFVNRLIDPLVSVTDLTTDPFSQTGHNAEAAPCPIGLPASLYGTERTPAQGIDLSDPVTQEELARSFARQARRRWNAAPPRASYAQRRALNASKTPTTALWSASVWRAVVNPAQRNDIVGYVLDADAADVTFAVRRAAGALPDWCARSPEQRARILCQGADLLQVQYLSLTALLIRETGKTHANAVSEIRETIDFLRFYAHQAVHLGPAIPLGVVCCISPWNFPLSIFAGQISAALATGNVVLAKPAEQTPLVAAHTLQLLHAAGVPVDAAQLLPGPGPVIGRQLVSDPHVKGVLFTGSLGVAQSINRVLAQRASHEGTMLPFVAETGGQNAMIVDASALPEQVVQDILASAFDSAGQRCSALRIVCLQEDIASEVLHMLHGAMQELTVGNPASLATDVGPVINLAAQQRLAGHIAHLRHSGATVVQPSTTRELDRQLLQGTFVLPTVIEITRLAMLDREVFGPVLHVLRFRHADLPSLIAAINATGYGLTFGIHSRMRTTIDMLIGHINAGNIYVNRTTIGAVVGSQPFGGEGLSGTGPKVAGPLYLRRLIRETPVPVSATPGITLQQCSPVSLQIPALPSQVFAHDWCQWCAHWNTLFAAATCAGATPQAPSALLLPGPTGEHNSLRLVPRGTVLCIPSTPISLIQQLDAAFRTGNCVLIRTSQAHLLPADLPDVIRTAITFVTSADLPHTVIHAALIDVQSAGAWQTDLAARHGQLVRTVLTSVRHPVALSLLVWERSIAVNTTAAGGDTALLCAGS